MTNLENFFYQGVPVSKIIRVPAYSHLHRRTIWKNTRFILFILNLFPLFRGLWKIICKPRMNADMKINENSDKFFLVVIDHNIKSHIQTELNITEALKFNTKIVTSEFSVSRNLRKLFNDHYNVLELVGYPGLTRQNLSFIRSFYKLVKNIEGHWSFKIELCFLLLRAIGFIEFYNRNLNKENIMGILTLCDLFPHEFIVTFIAKKKRIPTFTLQHGMFNPLFLKVESDKIFVWGTSAKSQLISAKVPLERIEIAGKPGFDLETRNFLNNPQAFKTQFVKKYSLPTGKLIVAYVATNWGMYENKEFFDAFSVIFKMDMISIIKLRPQPGFIQKKYYQRWLQKSEVGKKHLLFTNENIFEMYKGIDLLVTCHSASPVEAMCYGVPAILLDFFDYMNVKDMVTHYNDCLVVKNKNQFKKLLERLFAERDYLDSLKIKALENSKKYFFSPEKATVSEFTATRIETMVNENEAFFLA